MDSTHPNDPKNAKIDHDKTAEEDEKLILYGYCTKCQGFGPDGALCVTRQCCMGQRGMLSYYSSKNVQCNCCGSVYEAQGNCGKVEYTGRTPKEFKEKVFNSHPSVRNEECPCCNIKGAAFRAYPEYKCPQGRYDVEHIIDASASACWEWRRDDFRCRGKLMLEKLHIKDVLTFYDMLNMPAASFANLLKLNNNAFDIIEQ